MSRTDVVVVGAGLSGLAAARALVAAGRTSSWSRRATGVGPADRRRAAGGVRRLPGALLREQARHPVEYLERDWTAEEFSRGCYGAHLTPGVWTAYGPALTEPVGRIHWAGTECSPVWNGYMEGAVRSGEATAAAVAALLGAPVEL